MKKKILILGAGNAQIDVIKYCKIIGLEVHGLSYTDTDSAIPLLDYFSQINIVDVQAVEKYYVENKIDYIYSVGSDIAVPTINTVAENTNTAHFVSSNTANICCNKNLMRMEIGTDCEYNVPHMCCENIEEAEKVGFYPLMIKPIDSQGQRGVFKVKNFNELKEKFETSIQYSKSKKVILEKYIDGDEVSVNSYVVNGKVVFSIISDRESFSRLPGGIIKAHHLPSRYNGTETEELINKLVSEVVERLNIINGPVYFQIKVMDKRPYVIEVTPRLDGCHMWKLIEKYCGINLLSTTIKHLMGEKISFEGYKESLVPWHTEFYCEKPDTIFDRDKYSAYFSDEESFYYKTGDKVKQMNGFMEKCGYRMFKSPQRVGLIGGSSMIGKALMKLYSNEVEFKDISRKSGTITEYTESQIVEQLKDCDSVVILAAKKVNPKEEQSLELYDVNSHIVENSLKACKKLGIKNVIFISSRCVYDNMQGAPISENGVVNPINYYGISKISSELLCNYYNINYGFNIKILRLSQVIGNDDNGYMISKFIENAEKGSPLNIYGAGIGKRDYIYVNDVCNAIWRALLNYQLSGVYNIGSGIGATSVDLAQSVISALKSNSEIIQLKDKPEDTTVTFLDTKKAKDELGFECKYNLKEAFEDLLK